MSQKSINDPNSFCYVCGKVVLKSMRASITPQIKTAYERYFGRELIDQDKYWVPHFFCQRCATMLSLWADGYMCEMPFAIPIVWKEPKNSEELPVPVPSLFENLVLEKLEESKEDCEVETATSSKEPKRMSAIKHQQLLERED